MAHLLIIEDEPVFIHQLAVALRAAGHEVDSAGTAAEGLRTAEVKRPDLVLLDMRLPDRSGLELIGDLLTQDASLMVVLMTAYGSTQDAVEAIRRGAVDYLSKPLEMGELRVLIEKLLEKQRRDRELDYLRNRWVVESGSMAAAGGALGALGERIIRLCDPHAPAGKRPPILLTGECEESQFAVVRALHTRLGRGPFVSIHSHDFPSERLATELFGVEPISSAHDRASPGLFEAAQGGMLFLQEIADLPLEIQNALHRALTEQTIRRVSSTRDRATDVHIIVSTRHDPAELVSAGRLEEKLSTVLSGLSFYVPSLRERKDELPALCNRHASTIGERFDGLARSFSPDAIDLLVQYDWPGNHPELRNLIERAVWSSRSPEIGVGVTRALLEAGDPRQRAGRLVLPEGGVKMEEVEKDLVLQALQRANGNQTKACAMLGLSRDTLRYRIRKFGLEDWQANPE